MSMMKRIVTGGVGALLMLCGVVASAQDVAGRSEVIPLYPSYSEQILASDSLTQGLSPEALQVIGRPLQLRTSGYVPSSSAL